MGPQVFWNHRYPQNHFCVNQHIIEIVCCNKSVTAFSKIVHFIETFGLKDIFSGPHINNKIIHTFLYDTLQRKIAKTMKESWLKLLRNHSSFFFLSQFTYCMFRHRLHQEQIVQEVHIENLNELFFHCRIKNNAIHSLLI